MTRIIIIFLCFISILVNGQNPSTIKIKKIPVDTIDYSSFGFGIQNRYFLKTIKQFKGEERTYSYDASQLFFNLADQKSIDGLFSNSLLKIKLNDTIALTGWDRNTKDINNLSTKWFSVLKLNKLTNIFQITQEVLDKKTKKYVVRIKQFKVIKWSFVDIILYDMTLPNLIGHITLEEYNTTGTNNKQAQAGGCFDYRSAQACKTL